MGNQRNSQVAAKLKRSKEKGKRVKERGERKEEGGIKSSGPRF
jgi:hypothetical protein